MQLLGMLIAGAAGVASALVADFVQKGDASAIIVMNAFLNNTLDLHLPLGYLALALLGAGALSVFVFEPATKRAAYYTGASILAVLMTTMPVEDLESAAPLIEEIFSPGTMSPDETGPVPGAPVEEMGWHPGLEAPCAPAGTGIVAASFGPVRTMDRIACLDDDLQPQFIPVAAGELEVTVAVSVPDGRRLPRLSARLHDDVSGGTWVLSGGRAVKTSNGYIVRYQTMIPTSGSGSPIANLHVRVEARGYAIAQAEKAVTDDSQPVVLTVALQKSTTPLWLQKLNTPYRF